jgi:PAS domain S-box-containing protein
MNKIPDLFFDFFPELSLPDGFWTAENEGECCMYIATCTEDEFLYATDSFEFILGYSTERLYNAGLKWWFSLIHPEDLQPMLNIIFQHCFMTPVAKRLHKPFTLRYRIKHAEGHWIWLSEVKCIVAVTEEGKNHFVVGRFEEVCEDKVHSEYELKRLMQDYGGSNSMLKAAIPILTGKVEDGHSAPTKREKEILHLIGEGLSTKQMAEKLHISVNTVETHRRHLLEKLKVKNSMELIKQTSNAIWMKAIS